MPPKPTITAKRILAQTRIFRVDELDLTFSNGNRTCFETLHGGDNPSVLIVPLLDARTIILVREYAAAYDRYELGFPKGLAETDENLLEAANRELMEEIGYAASDLEVLRSVTLAPGYIRHETHVILARDLAPARRRGDEPEPIQVVAWSLDRSDELLQRPDFTEARSIAALLLVKDLIAS